MNSSKLHLHQIFDDFPGGFPIRQPWSHQHPSSSFHSSEFFMGENLPASGAPTEVLNGSSLTVRCLFRNHYLQITLAGLPSGCNNLGVLFSNISGLFMISHGTIMAKVGGKKEILGEGEFFALPIDSSIQLLTDAAADVVIFERKDLSQMTF